MQGTKVKHICGTNHVVDLEPSDRGALIANLFNCPTIPEQGRTISTTDACMITIRGRHGGIRRGCANARFLTLGTRYDLYGGESPEKVRQKNATIFPLANISAVVFGSRKRMMAALKRFGLYLRDA
jgi:hypothetical protein